MRDYGRVYTTFWADHCMRASSEDARMLALYLKTSPHSTIAGVFRLPDGYVCDDLQWSSERVAKAFAELLSNGFANRCETTKWVWVCEHFVENRPDNPNQRKAAAKIAVSVPDDCSWKPEFMRDCSEVLALDPWTPPNRSETVPKPLPNQEQKQEQKQHPDQDQDQEQKQNQEQYRGALQPPGPPAFAPTPSAPPPAAATAATPKPGPAPAPKPRKAAEPKAELPTVGTWKAYSQAYGVRYHTDPLRNAMVNGQLANLVARLGAEVAPAVAAFYVRSNNARYVGAGHSIGMLLMDAEKLHTEWKTGQQGAHTQARLVSCPADT